MVITATSKGIILLALVEKSELNWANLKAPQDGGQEVEEEKNHISISAACEAAEERDDKCCGAARLLSAYRLKSSRCCSAAEFRRRGTRSPPTLASKQKCYLRRGTIRPPREPPPQPTCNHHSCSRPGDGDAPERSELRRMTWHFLKIVCFCFGFLLPSFIFLFADITGLNESITMSDMTFCCSAVSALRATYKKCWSDKTKVTAYLENNRRWKSNITNIYSYLDIWRSPWSRTVLCYFVKIRGDNILLLKRI